MPDFGSRTLVHINPKADFESSKGSYEEIKNRKTLDFLNNIEKHSVFKVFLKIKRLLAENRESECPWKNLTIGVFLSVYSIAPKVSDLTVFPSTEPSDFSEK